MRERGVSYVAASHEKVNDALLHCLRRFLCWRRGTMTPLRSPGDGRVQIDLQRLDFHSSVPCSLSAREPFRPGNAAESGTTRSRAPPTFLAMMSEKKITSNFVTKVGTKVVLCLQMGAHLQVHRRSCVTNKFRPLFWRLTQKLYTGFGLHSKPSTNR